MAAPEGIEGVDLLEIDIICKKRLPAAQGAFQECESLVHPGDVGYEQFARPGNVGDAPNGPSAEWRELATSLETALNTSITNLGDTAAAFEIVLRDILAADHGAQGRLDKARAELEGTGDYQ